MLEDGSVLEDPQQTKAEARWLLHIDRSSSTVGFGAGLVFTISEGIMFEYAIRFAFSVSNNETEYKALLVELRIARNLRVKRLNVYTDSQLVTGYMQEEFKAREPNMVQYL